MRLAAIASQAHTKLVTFASLLSPKTKRFRCLLLGLLSGWFILYVVYTSASYHSTALRQAVQKVLNPCSNPVMQAVSDLHDSEGRVLDTSVACIHKTNHIDCRNDTTSPPCQLEWVTVSSRCTGRLEDLALLTRHLGIKFTVLGYNVRWVGFGRRIRLLRDYLRTVPSHRIVLFTDADDVFPLPSCSPSVITERFLAMNVPALWMSERACWPDSDKWAEYPKAPKPTPFNYINGGGYMGFAWALEEIISKAWTDDRMDDQRGFTSRYLEQCRLEKAHREYMANVTATNTSASDTPSTQVTLPEGIVDIFSPSYPRIQLDWYNSLLEAMYDARIEDYDFSNYTVDPPSGVVRNKHTNGTPCIFHQNGNKAVPWVAMPFLTQKIGLDDLVLRLEREEATNRQKS